MTAQLDLLRVPREAPYQRTSPTSREAARQVRGPKAKRQRERVYMVLADAGDSGLIMHQIADRLRIPVYSVCARFSELKDPDRGGPYIEETGEKRRTPAGGWAAVWRVKKPY